MAKKRILTGIKPTGKPHLGNYLGAIRPAIQRAAAEDIESALFIADYHALTSVHDAKELKQSTYEVAATWLASGLDPKKSLIYRQSDVPEIFELAWVISCFTPKGLMNRAHAYKAKVQANEEAGRKDLDDGVNMGLYFYPVLMAADILIFSADEVPVGEDQIQHIEIARDIVGKFNKNYGEVLKMPNFKVNKETKLVPGLDGRKMSKSYNNYISMFETSKKFRKLIMKIKTDSSAPEDPKDPSDSIIFDLYKEFANETEINELAEKYKVGIGWGEAKQFLFEAMEKEFASKREHYDELMADTSKIDVILDEGAERTRVAAKELLSNVRQAIGV